MKISFIAIALLLNGMFYAQQNYKMFTGPLASINKEYEKNGREVLGTPYANTNFLPSLIPDSPESILVRYDANKDLVEVLIDEKVYELPKIEKFSTLKFKNSDITLVYIENNGYFFRLVNGTNQLLKKEKIQIQNVKPSIEPNSMIKDGYSKFEKVSPTYYIKTQNSLEKVSKDEQSVISLFPDKKPEIEDFMKKNKIKLKNEFDLIKLVNFLNK